MKYKYLIHSLIRFIYLYTKTMTYAIATNQASINLLCVVSMLYVWLLQLRIPFDFLLTSLLLLYRRRWARGHTFSRCYTIYFKLFFLKHICMHVWLNGTKLLNTFYLTIIIIITIILTQTYTKYYMAFCHCAVHIRLISKKEFPYTHART